MSSHQDLINEINNYYTMYYMQLYRVKYNSTYVEKSILSNYVNSIQEYFLNRINELEEYLKNSLETNLNSYYSWSSKFYQEDYDKKMDAIKELRNRVNNTRNTKFLSLNLTIEDPEIEREFSKFIIMPTNKDVLLKKDPNLLCKTKKNKNSKKND